MDRGWVFALTIAIGLPVAATDMAGLLDRWVAEALVVVWCWGLFLYDHVTSERRRRLEIGRIHRDVAHGGIHSIRQRPRRAASRGREPLQVLGAHRDRIAVSNRDP